MEQQVLGTKAKKKNNSQRRKSMCGSSPPSSLSLSYMNVFIDFCLLAAFETVLIRTLSTSRSSLQTLPYTPSCSPLNSWPLFKSIVSAYIYVFVHTCNHKYNLLSTYSVTCACVLVTSEAIPIKPPNMTAQTWAEEGGGSLVGDFLKTPGISRGRKILLLHTVLTSFLKRIPLDPGRPESRGSSWVWIWSAMLCPCPQLLFGQQCLPRCLYQALC